ncbi:hypothetical protein [Chitinophaga dinghuensis]|uniref:hypothetical protein n=1 Tax=Chitinophaga dinghuensis TaxID=1539050 RepID=UPI0011B93D11|nr:hypothetical protein [Chitinophaga dinghuensis]
MKQLPNKNFATDTIGISLLSGCKSSIIIPVELYNGPLGDTRLPTIRERFPRAAAPLKSNPFLKIHGNVSYDGFYQSNTDTPYLEKDIQQHTLSTNLDITVKDQYPLRVAFSTSKGNSMLFRNLTGINLRYTNRDFKQMLLDKAKGWEAGKLKQLKELDSLQTMLNTKWSQLEKLKNWFNSPQQVQRLIEAKEHDYNLRFKKAVTDISKLERPDFSKPTVNMPSWKKEVDLDSDSAVAKLRNEFARKQQELDSMKLVYDGLEKFYNKKKLAYGNKKTKLLDVIHNSKSDEELISSLESMNLPDSVLPKGYKTLLALKSVGIGRTMVDYSELTAKNISITGVQAEFNPSWYFAFATGAVDYRFRDYVVNANRAKQYLNIVRVGTGLKEGNNIILSFYTGKKQVYNFNTGANGGNVETPDYKIMGVSLEGRWQINRNHYITGEVAKSSTPYYARVAEHQSLGSSMVQFNNHSNEAFAVTAFSYIPQTATRITGMYKLMGADFQSFSLYTPGTQQVAWQLKAEQPFFKKQLTVVAAIKRNAYNNFFDSTNYSSSTIFKSIQATFRRRHWPVVSVGYFPSSQLMKMSDDKFIENMFYTMMGTVSHNYTAGAIGMNTMITATRFYNRQVDSSFVYFNSTNLQLTQTLFVKKFTLTGGANMSSNQDYALYGTDGNVQYQVTRWLEVGGGLKYNYQTVFRNEQTGYSGNIRLNVPKIGEFGLMADKGFVPGVNRQLVPNKTGRLTYTKIF